MIHVLNGHAPRLSLEQSGIPGEITVWGDVLYDGPVPIGVSDAELREVRARFHAGEFVSYQDAIAMGERWDDGLERAAASGEATLWFEHDLHDQVLLARQLDWFAQRAPDVALDLICIGEFPGVQPFHGIGQLNPEQLASLWPTRRRVDAAQTALGRAAWNAIAGDDPRAIERVLAGDTTALPFLAGALERLLEEFPDARSGLPRTERTMLELLDRDGPLSFVDLFTRQQKTEERVFMGDSTFWSRVTDLASGTRPLVAIEPAGEPLDIARTRIAITDDGRRSLAGTLDWMQTGAFERWIGGTHWIAPGGGWRWNAAERRLSFQE